MEQIRATGRPRKQPDEQRRERSAGIRWTAAERDYLALLVERSGLDEADFCRRAILGQRVPVRRAKASDALLYELNRIGNNLNQVAKAAHLGKPLAGMLDHSLAELRAIMEQVAAADAGGADGS